MHRAFSLSQIGCMSLVGQQVSLHLKTYRSMLFVLAIRGQKEEEEEEESSCCIVTSLFSREKESVASACEILDYFVLPSLGGLTTWYWGKDTVSPPGQFTIPYRGNHGCVALPKFTTRMLSTTANFSFYPLLTGPLAMPFLFTHYQGEAPSFQD